MHDLWHCDTLISLCNRHSYLSINRDFLLLLGFLFQFYFNRMEVKRLSHQTIIKSSLQFGSNYSNLSWATSLWTVMHSVVCLLRFFDAVEVSNCTSCCFLVVIFTINPTILHAWTRFFVRSTFGSQCGLFFSGRFQASLLIFDLLKCIPLMSRNRMCFCEQAPIKVEPWETRLNSSMYLYLNRTK